MNRAILSSVVLCAALAVFLSGCNTRGKADSDIAAEAPPPTHVEEEQDVNIVKVDHPEQFPIVAATERKAAPQLKVTGTINPDVSRSIPVISLASGRVVDIHAQLGDTVTKGQLLMRVQSADISQAISDYRQAVADQQLAASQLDRSKVLFDKGAIAQKDLQVAENAAAKADVTVETALEHLRVLGVDLNHLDHPAAVIDITAPAAGVIVEQNVTQGAGVKTLDNSPNLFTIADLGQVWVLCDVYENDLPFVRVGEYADIHVDAYPHLILKGRIANIGPILDPNIRTAKVRLELHNPGELRVGMFVSATFYGQQQETRATVPSSAVLHLHDRDWVYVPTDGGRYQRIEVAGGDMLPGNLQEITSGIKPGQQVVANALVLENAVEQ